MSDLFQTAVVTGAGRGFGRAIAAALVTTGTSVVGIARDEQRLLAVRDELGEGFTPVAADATDEALAQNVIREHRPGLLVLNAGATPHMAPVHEQTWETFSRNWHADTRHVFTWTRAALREPLAPGSVVVAMSSGAVLGGSPLSGGYASAKAAIRYIRGYAADESERAGLDIRFVTLLPQPLPAATSVGIGRTFGRSPGGHGSPRAVGGVAPTGARRAVRRRRPGGDRGREDWSAARFHRRTPVPARATAGRTDVARRAGVPDGRGRRDAGHDDRRRRQRAPARPGPSGRSRAGRGRPGRAGRGNPKSPPRRLRRRVHPGRPRRAGEAAAGRRRAGDAADPDLVHRPAGRRRVPGRSGTTQGAVADGAHPRQRPGRPPRIRARRRRPVRGARRPGPDPDRAPDQPHHGVQRPEPGADVRSRARAHDLNRAPPPPGRSTTAEIKDRARHGHHDIPDRPTSSASRV
ncbi:SDR family oxidoreductase [Actinomadura alba]|uniref:SDR family oxidoreductase n=1 Tax=Actinomadura alba TaxID=406431 RepID=A0ABR7LQE6_9ACTN|nr:SDR family oxidoreductase [Actinomadura alba]